MRPKDAAPVVALACADQHGRPPVLPVRVWRDALADEPTPDEHQRRIEQDIDRAMAAIDKACTECVVTDTSTAATEVTATPTAEPVTTAGRPTAPPELLVVATDAVRSFAIPDLSRRNKIALDGGDVAVARLVSTPDTLAPAVLVLLHNTGRCSVLDPLQLRQLGVADLGVSAEAVKYGRRVRGPLRGLVWLTDCVDAAQLVHKRGHRAGCAALRGGGGPGATTLRAVRAGHSVRGSHGAPCCPPSPADAAHRALPRTAVAG